MYGRFSNDLYLCSRRQGGELHWSWPVCVAGDHKKGYQEGIGMDVGGKVDIRLIHVLRLYRARKLLNLRLFEEPTSGKGWEKSVSDLGLEILCVSQVSYYYSPCQCYIFSP